MFTLEKSIEIDAPVEQVFAFVVDPTHEPEYMPGTDEVKDLQRLPDGRYTHTNVSKFLGLHMEFKNEQVEVIPNERIVEKMHGAGMESTITFRFERLGDTKTRVSFVAENSLHGAGPLTRFGEVFMSKYTDHGTAMAMEAAKAHIEAETLAATPR